MSNANTWLYRRIQAVLLIFSAVSFLGVSYGSRIIAARSPWLSLMAVCVCVTFFFIGVRLWARAEELRREASRKSLARVLQQTEPREPLAFHRRLR